MPLINDPGSELVAAAVAAGHAVIPIAGPSAFLLALVASGMTSRKFKFVGSSLEKLWLLTPVHASCLRCLGFDCHLVYQPLI